MLQNCKFCLSASILEMITDYDTDGILRTEIRCNRCTQMVKRNTPQAAEVAWNVAQNNVPTLWDEKTEEAFNKIMRGGVE